MKIRFNRSNCIIAFEENDKYSGKELLIDGEGDLIRDFGIYKSQVCKMCWRDTSTVGERRFEYVDAELRDEVLCYVIEEAKKLGFSLALW